MNKSKLAIGLMTAVLSAGALAGCDNTVKYSDDGAIITYHEGDNSTTVTADDLLVDYYKDSSKYQSIFDAIYSIVVRNYFTTDEEVTVMKTNADGSKTPVTKLVGKSDMTQINNDADRKVEADKKTAQTNASNNGTSYKTEFDSILSSKGAKDEAELKEKYVEELQKETFDSNFYKYHIDDVKLGDEDIKFPNTDKQMWTGYFKDMVPYHVSHILIKVEDGSGTNYANGTISKDNAENLYRVVEALKLGEYSFEYNAKRFSEDTGSAANYGDLGIMDYSTGYVNEFKLGIYAYENFLGANVADVKNSNIVIPGNEESTIKTGSPAESYVNEITESFDLDTDEVPSIDYSIFEELNKVADIDKDVNDNPVIDDSANFYPRNIIYNKYLNRHSVAFITTKDEGKLIPNDKVGIQPSGFYKINGINVLCVWTASGYSPVLVARAGSDYQGIHFIVVNRSPFAGEGDKKVVDGVSLNDYYTTYYPEQEDYPIDAETKEPLKTYINFYSESTTDTKSRADSLVSTLKSYDSERLNKYIFERYFEHEKISIKDEALKDALYTWILRGFEKKEQEKTEAWEKTWRDYVDTLAKQNAERNKLVSQACRIAYLNGNNRGEDGKELEDISAIIDAMATAMVEAGEAADTTEAKAIINSVKIGNNTVPFTITSIAQLFKMKGALCNDGKDHL